MKTNENHSSPGMEHSVHHGHSAQLGKGRWVVRWPRVDRVDKPTDVGVGIPVALVLCAHLSRGVEHAAPGNVAVPGLADDGGEGRVGGSVIVVGQDPVCVGAKTEPIALVAIH